MDVFSPSKKLMCTCMPKYSLNTYLGRCQHKCIYCYSVKFPMFRGKVKPNLLLAQNIELMAKNKKKRLPVMICSNTDPYQPLEEKYLVTRKCIEVLARYNFPLMIFTKSHLITRDLDVLKKANALVVMTVTTMNPEIQRKIEPAASTPNERLAALKNYQTKE